MTFNPERHGNGKFKKGSGGKPVGARNKLQATFVTALEKDFHEHGAGVINIVRVEKPVDYLKIIASTLPKEFIVSETEFDGMTDDEIMEALAVIRAARESQGSARQ